MRHKRQFERVPRDAERHAAIPNNDGGWLLVRTCVRGEACGNCASGSASKWTGDIEAAAREHAAEHRIAEGRVHVLNSGGRMRTFKVWQANPGVYMSREVL